MTRTIILLTVMLLGIFSINGCGKQEPSAEEEATKTVEQFEDEAEKEIDRGNLQSELDKLESEVEGDFE